MSSEAGRSVSYVLGRPVSAYMDRDVLLLPAGTPTSEAARRMQHRGEDDIVVVASGSAVGIVTDEDILNKVGDAGVHAEATSVGDIMSSPLVTIDGGAPVREALRRMRDGRVRKLPVVSRSGAVVGIIRQHVIANAIREANATPPRLLSPPVKAVLGNLGFVLQFAGVLLLVPAILATALGDTETATGIYLTTVLLLVTGFFLNSYGEKAALNMQQASILVFASLFILVLFGTVPYMYVSQHGHETPAEAFASGFFSSAAGFTTGGISLFESPGDLPQSFTFYRSFTQLVGGMSFIYLVITAFYPESKLHAMRGFISGRTLHMRELFGTITVIFGIYILIITSLLYALGSHDIIDNFSLVMSTLATGGFVPSEDMLGSLGWQQRALLMSAMVLGALPFTFHYAFVRKRFMVRRLGREALAYFGILGAGALAFTWASGAPPADGAFHAVSASTTAGLQEASLAGAGTAGHAVLIALMFAGGCGFSTAGGIKVFRLFHAAGAWRMALRGRRAGLGRAERKEAVNAVVILALFPAMAAAAGLHLHEATGASLENSFFEAVGLVTTGGLSAGVIDVGLDPASKIAMGFLMIFGRLEIIAILYIFLPRLAA